MAAVCRTPSIASSLCSSPAHQQSQPPRQTQGAEGWWQQCGTPSSALGAVQQPSTAAVAASEADTSCTGPARNG